jgi:hypothetical protein
MLYLLHAVVPTLRGLVAAVLVVALVFVVAFAPAALIDSGVLGALLGLALAAALVAIVRPRGLVGAWRYLRELT